jgi:large subunit ribosomal protein L3
MRRHNFAGGAGSHGSMFHRAPGSIGASSYPSRVVKGMRMAGHTGADRVTTRNLKVLRVDTDNHLLLLEGAVPGGPNGHVVIRKAVAAKPEPKPQPEKAQKGKTPAKGKK